MNKFHCQALFSFSSEKHNFLRTIFSQPPSLFASWQALFICLRCAWMEELPAALHSCYISRLSGRALSILLWHVISLVWQQNVSSQLRSVLHAFSMAKPQLLAFLMEVFVYLFQAFCVIQIVKLCRCGNVLRRFCSLSADVCMKRPAVWLEMVKVWVPAENFSLKIT